MFKCIYIGVVTMAVSGSAFAADQTCKAFEKKFDDNLKRSAREAPALTISEGRKTETNPHMTYRISSKEALSGNIECFNADYLREFDIAVDLKDANAAESARRVGLLRKVAAASVCAIGNFSVAKCEAATSDLFSKVHRQLQLAAAHKDPLPAADEYLGFVDNTELNLSAMTGQMQFSIFVNSGASAQ